LSKTVSSTGLPLVIQELSNNTLKDDAITTPGEQKWFKFPATAGRQYEITLDDSYNGSGTKTANVRLNVYTSTGTAITTNIDTAWFTPITISASDSEVYLLVRAYCLVILVEQIP
jgi:hypothetical protein